MENIGADLAVMKPVPLAVALVDAIRVIGSERSYAAGDIIARLDGPMDRFQYVVEGEIEVLDPLSDERMDNAVLGPGQFGRELSFLRGGNYYLAIRVVGRTVTIEVTCKAMLYRMAQVPELSDRITAVFAARRQQLIERRTSSIKVIGSDRDPDIQKVEAFLSGNRIPFKSFDLDSGDGEALALCKLAGHEPAVTLDHDREIAHPTPRQVARELNMNLGIDDGLRIDILIVHGEPAGVSAAVNAGAEGLSTLVVEDIAIGGQAGASSTIENYLGFPTGIRGADLLFRGQIQAPRFGACFATPRRVERLSVEKDGLFCVVTRVQYRRLPLERLEEFENAGVVYAATETEAGFCRNTDAVIVGGGNSAGQAAMHLSRVARHVQILVRGDNLSDTMSSYCQLSRPQQAGDAHCVRNGHLII